ncbi:transient receptor potential cation channel subfamily V member 1 [Sarcophilus harrisii]|uniref:transient receptor potential cation channel subfamily V member 1 n=1 Tax=Sarcophilus harrisii TaxID=9305 RepID=UPI001301FA82|nr:transient receptor potential cation channel subfamily V member 1 [Sarcophilus harrisii]
MVVVVFGSAGRQMVLVNGFGIGGAGPGSALLSPHTLELSEATLTVTSCASLGWPGGLSHLQQGRGRLRLLLGLASPARILGGGDPRAPVPKKPRLSLGWDKGQLGEKELGGGNSRSRELGDNGLPYRPEMMRKPPGPGDCPEGKAPDLDSRRGRTSGAGRSLSQRPALGSNLKAEGSLSVAAQGSGPAEGPVQLCDSGISPTEEVVRRCALMKALLRSQDKSESRGGHEYVLSCTDVSPPLPSCSTFPYTDKFYCGQTALHIAIERGPPKSLPSRWTEYCLGAEAGSALGLRAAGGKSLTGCRGLPGEYPLSLAACTCQPDMVRFLMARADSDLARTQDTFGNTVLHALVLRAQNQLVMVKMYLLVLELSEERRLRDGTASMSHLEKVRNLQGLTPLQLAAKEGQLELFQCILTRELSLGDSMTYLGRRFCEWSYGPISCSLYDLSELDTTEPNSALKMVAFHPDMEKASDLLAVEPLRSLLQAKWASFAGALFAVSTAWYLSYIGLFTALTAQRPGMEGSQVIFLVLGPWSPPPLAQGPSPLPGPAGTGSSPPPTEMPIQTPAQGTERFLSCRDKRPRGWAGSVLTSLGPRGVRQRPDVENPQARRGASGSLAGGLFWGSRDLRETLRSKTGGQGRRMATFQVTML